MITSDKPVPSGTIRGPFDVATIVARTTTPEHQTPTAERARLWQEYVEYPFISALGNGLTIQRIMEFPVLSLTVCNQTDQYLFVLDANRYILPFTENATFHMPGNNVLSLVFKAPFGIVQLATPKGPGIYLAACEERQQPQSGFSSLSIFQTLYGIS